MKKYTLFLGIFALMLLATPVAQASAATTYYYLPSSGYQYQPAQTYQAYNTNYGSMDRDQLIQYLLKLINELQARLADQNQYGYGYGYNYGCGSYYCDHSNFTYSSPRSNSSNDDEPEADTDPATGIGDDDAYLRGSVDMNDYDDGRVFFVYGQDESQIEDVEDDYDTYNDVDEDGDDLQKVSVDSSLDGDEDYSKHVYNLDDNEDYYFQICVEWEDDDNDDVLTCGGVRHFETD